MNIVFTALTLISIVMLTVASPATAFPTMLQGVMNAITLIFKLATKSYPSYCALLSNGYSKRKAMKPTAGYL